ncbi:MAG: hypothetical protein IPM21_15880 [Acidobacteria bacterium]|nr:hypothetical protein [Acidobacteriota bacterium]
MEIGNSRLLLSHHLLNGIITIKKRSPAKPSDKQSLLHPGGNGLKMSKRSSLLFLVTSVTAIVCIDAHAQTRKIEEAEFRSKISTASRLRAGLPMRVTVTTEGYAPGDSSRTVYDHGPDGAMRIAVSRTSKGVETKSETIRIGGNVYARQNDDGWRKVEVSSGRGSAVAGGRGTGTLGPPPKIEIEYLYLGKHRINGQKADRYTKSIKTTSSIAERKFVRTFVEEYWYREDGMLLRMTSEDTIPPSKYRTTTEYDYTSTIIIEPPIK